MKKNNNGSSTEKKIFCVFCAAIMIITASKLCLGASINEIMYNPPGDDNNKEFVEIIGTDNLSGYTVGDSSSNDSLVLLKYIPGNFSLITEDGFNHSAINCSVYSAGATIGNNLNNDNDSVFLYKNSSIVDFASYDGSFANSNNFSLELVNGSWRESCAAGGSPGVANCPLQDIENITDNNTEANDTINNTINNTINITDNISINNTINDTLNITTNITDENITTNATVNITENITINETINVTTNSTANNTINTTTNLTNSSTEQNITELPIALEIIIPDQLLLGVTYNSLFRITNNLHVPGTDNPVNVSVNYYLLKDNITFINSSFSKLINSYSSSSTGILLTDQAGNYTFCGHIPDIMLSVCKNISVIGQQVIPCSVNLSMSTDKELYNDGEQVKIINSLSSEDYPYIIQYWIEDLFGEIIKQPNNTTNTNAKSYTSGIDEKDRVFIIKNKLVFIGCNNTGQITESEKKIFVIKEMAGDENEGENSNADNTSSESSIEIEQASLPDEGLVFGDRFNAKLNIHKGDTAKTLVNAFVKDSLGKKVSEETTFYLNRKKSDYNITIKIWLKKECLASDGYYLVVEGLGLNAEQEITIERNEDYCAKETEQSSKTEQKSSVLLKNSTGQKNSTKENNSTKQANKTMEKKIEGEIISFYTRTQNYRDNISIYANVKSNGTAQLVLISDKEELIANITGNESKVFQAKAKPGNNSYILELRKQGRVLDTRSLQVNLTMQETTKKTSVNLVSFADKKNNSLENSSMSSITGDTVYLSSNEKAKNISPLIILVTVLLAILGLKKLVKKKKSERKDHVKNQKENKKNEKEAEELFNG